MYTTQNLLCPVCEANVPFSEGRTATCLFCFHSFLVPEKFLVPVEKNTDLEAQLTDAVSKRQSLLSFSKSEWWSFLGLVALISVPYSIAFAFTFRARGDETNLTMNKIIFGGWALLLPVVSVLQYLVTRRVSLKKMARLPCTKFRIDGVLRLCCPECGAPIQASPKTIIATCQHCDTESLLPSYLIDDILSQKYKKIARFRRDLGAVENEISSYFFAPSLGLILFGAIPIFAILYTTPPGKLPDATIGCLPFFSFVDMGIYIAIRKSKLGKILASLVYLFWGITIAFAFTVFFPGLHLIAVYLFDGILFIGFGVFLLFSGLKMDRKPKSGIVPDSDTGLKSADVS